MLKIKYSITLFNIVIYSLYKAHTHYKFTKRNRNSTY